MSSWRSWRNGELYFIAPERATRQPKAWERRLLPWAYRLQCWLEDRSDQLRIWSYKLDDWRAEFQGK